MKKGWSSYVRRARRLRVSVSVVVICTSAKGGDDCSVVLESALSHRTERVVQFIAMSRIYSHRSVDHR